MSPEAEKTARTPEQFVKIGEATGMSPERLKVATGKLLPANPITWLSGLALGEENYKALSDLPGIRKIYRTTTPRALSGDDLSAAKKLKIETKGVAPAEVLKEIQAKQREVNTVRQKNDVTFDKLIASVKSGEASMADVYRAAWKVKDESGKFSNQERKRILKNLKHKYPKLNIVAPSGD